MQLIRAATPIWRLTLILASILGGLLLAGGILIALLGGSAKTSFTLFGNQFSSTSVGLSMAFIGAVLVGMAISRTLRSLDHIASGSEEKAAK